MSEWQKVVCGCEVGEDDECPGCGGFYSECGCPGPTQEEEFEYEERADGLYARRLPEI